MVFCVNPEGPPKDPQQTHDGAPMEPQWSPDGAPMEPWWSPDGALMEPRWIFDQTQLPWIVSSKWALQCLFTFWNIMNLDCNSNCLALYSTLFFDTDVYNESWLTYYYQWLDPGNGSTVKLGDKELFGHPKVVP